MVVQRSCTENIMHLLLYNRGLYRYSNKKSFTVNICKLFSCLSLSKITFRSGLENPFDKNCEETDETEFWNMKDKNVIISGVIQIF